LLERAWSNWEIWTGFLDYLYPLECLQPI